LSFWKVSGAEGKHHICGSSSTEQNSNCIWSLPHANKTINLTVFLDTIFGKLHWCAVISHIYTLILTLMQYWEFEAVPGQL